MDKHIKCVVFDLDNTIWHGVVLENNKVTLNTNIKEILKELDNRGILMSIASKGEEEVSLKWLEYFDIRKYFLHPQINWNPKKDSIIKISNLLNIGTDTIAFIDDQKYELDEVSFFLPEVLCIDSKMINRILEFPRFNHDYYTEESKRRREYYISDIEYSKDKLNFIGNESEFYKQLCMEMEICRAEENDLVRLAELIDRTNKLNSTGIKISYDNLKVMYKDEKNILLKINFKDKYCEYGIIGMIFIEEIDDKWVIKLINFSCRIMSRNVCGYIINLICESAKRNNKTLLAEFISTDNNNLLKIILKSCGFELIKKVDEKSILINDFKNNLSKSNFIKTYIEI